MNLHKLKRTIDKFYTIPLLRFFQSCIFYLFVAIVAVVFIEIIINGWAIAETLKTGIAPNETLGTAILKHWIAIGKATQ